MTVPAASTPTRDVWRFEAIGTVWRIDTPEPVDARTRADVAGLVDAFDLEWSRFRPDSVITRIASGGSAPAPPDAAAMLAAYRELDEATAGAVNPLVGDALAARGYDAAYRFVDTGARPAPRRWADVLRVEAGMLRLAEPGIVDVGAVGKGRLVDRVSDLLAARGADVSTVDAGGDIRVRGTTERIALEHPVDPSRAIGVWTVSGGALCASAVNRRAWGTGLHHVLDARTGQPVHTVAASWAVAATAMQADAVATALFFDGGAELAHRWGVSWTRMTTDGRVEWSPGCAAELFL